MRERVFDAIPGFFAWLALIFCIICAFYAPRIVLSVAAVIGIYSALRFILAAIANVIGLRQIHQWEQTDFYAKYQQEESDDILPWDVVKHLVIIPNYEEPTNVLRRTLDALTEQHSSIDNMVVLLAMEGKEQHAKEKAEQLKEEYESNFLHLIYSIHPPNIEGELAGKSANEAWAAKVGQDFIVTELGCKVEHVCVTTMDADTRFHPKYFEALTYLFATSPNRHNLFWQSPIRYHGNVWDINPLMRIVNAYSTAFELAYLAAPWSQALPMSSYSLSLKLVNESGNWDVDVIAEDWHMYIKAFFAQKTDLDLQPIFLPFLADATIGDNIWGEIKARYSQTLRHAWGSKEVGYTLGKIIDTPGVPVLPGTRLLSRISHDILLAGAGWIILTVGSQLPLLINPAAAPFQLQNVLNNANPSQYILESLFSRPEWLALTIASTLVVILGIVFWWQDAVVRPNRTDPVTITDRVLTLLSFPLLPILTLIVVALPVLQAQTMLLVGRSLQYVVAKKA